jgi:SWI/SNF-related matrix-associated actin-dependent regulator 1 of chromatin subfamily A
MKRLMLLSGTPMLARPVELYNSLRLLRPDIFNDYNKFTDRYCDPKENPYGGKDYSGAAHI